MKKTLLLLVLVSALASLFAATPLTKVGGSGKSKIGGGGTTKEMPNSLITGLVAWWKFNDATGTSAIDSTGNGNTGTLTNGPTWTNGPSGNGAISFDGTDDYVAVANPSNFNFERTDSFSFSIWVKVSSSATGNGKSIINKQALTGNAQGIQIDAHSDNSALAVYLNGTTGEALNGGTGVNSFPANVWHHVAVTYDGSSNASGLKTYIDGSLASSSAGGPLTSSIQNSAQLYFGKTTAYFFGLLADPRVYNRVLSAAEVARLFSGKAQQ